MSSPTKRTLEHLRSQGYLVAIVEHWNPFARIRQDLFGIIDVLAVGNSETVAVQTTSASNLSARVAKITESDALPHIRDAGWKILVHGWRKNSKGKWVLKEVDIS